MKTSLSMFLLLGISIATLIPATCQDVAKNASKQAVIRKKSGPIQVNNLS